jgi:hypothetical protein
MKIEIYSCDKIKCIGDSRRILSNAKIPCPVCGQIMESERERKNRLYNLSLTSKLK